MVIPDSSVFPNNGRDYSKKARSSLKLKKSELADPKGKVKSTKARKSDSVQVDNSASDSGKLALNKLTISPDSGSEKAQLQSTNTETSRSREGKDPSPAGTSPSDMARPEAKPPVQKPGQKSPMKAKSPKKKVILKNGLKRKLRPTTEIEVLQTPCIASMENMGNTCFLNSVLQVLRYTPHFVEQLDILVEGITAATAAVKESGLQQFAGWKVPIQWRLVADLHETYEQMVLSEADFAMSATNPDVLVIHPDLLDCVCELNPQFEGNQQQDAHEFLQCLLSYIDDAWSDLRRLYTQLPPAFRLAFRPEGFIPLPAENGSKDESPGSSSEGSRNGGSSGQVNGAGGRRRLGLSRTVVTNGGGDADRKQPVKQPVIKLERCDDVMTSSSPSSSPSLKTCTKRLFGGGCEGEPAAKKMKKEEEKDAYGNLFKGEVAACVKCLECESVKRRRETFAEIHVPLHKASEDSDTEAPSSSSQPFSPVTPRGPSEAWPLRELRDQELLQGSNKYYCGVCLTLTEAARFVQYTSLPTCLTLHIKRFAAKHPKHGCAGAGYGGLTKINDYAPTPLSLPCMLDTCPHPCLDPTHTYELYAIINHTGESLSAGHYVSYIKLPRDYCPPATETASAVCVGRGGGWVECDDDRVRLLRRGELEDVVGEEARAASAPATTPYLLFYHANTGGGGVADRHDDHSGDDRLLS